MLDATDIRILDLLQGNARISNADIARELDMAPSAILDRIRKLEARSVITGYEARLDAHAVGFGLTAFILVRTEERVGSASIGQAIAKFPEVQEVHHVAGEDCYLVKVRVQDTDALGELAPRAFRPAQGGPQYPDDHRPLDGEGQLANSAESREWSRSMTDHASAPRWQMIAAFAAIYLIWGSTYLGIALAIQSMPPFIMAGSRFLLAGAALYIYARLTGSPRPNCHALALGRAVRERCSSWWAMAPWPGLKTRECPRGWRPSSWRWCRCGRHFSNGSVRVAPDPAPSCWPALHWDSAASPCWCCPGRLRAR